MIHIDYGDSLNNRTLCNSRVCWNGECHAAIKDGNISIYIRSVEDYVAYEPSDYCPDCLGVYLLKRTK